jgi:hypothetical protein
MDFLSLRLGSASEYPPYIPEIVRSRVTFLERSLVSDIAIKERFLKEMKIHFWRCYTWKSAQCWIRIYGEEGCSKVQQA